MHSASSHPLFVVGWLFRFCRVVSFSFFVGVIVYVVVIVVLPCGEALTADRATVDPVQSRLLVQVWLRLVCRSLRLLCPRAIQTLKSSPQNTFTCWCQITMCDWLAPTTKTQESTTCRPPAQPKEGDWNNLLIFSLWAVLGWFSFFQAQLSGGRLGISRGVFR